MEFITFISRIVLPLISIILIIKCVMTLWLGHPKEKTYGFIIDMRNGERHELNMWETSIGRGASCDIVLPYDSVARVHAVITRRLDGWYVYDLLNKPATGVNGVKVSKKQNLTDGDIITFSDKKFRFEVINDPVTKAGKPKKQKGKKTAAKSSTKASTPAQQTAAAKQTSDNQGSSDTIITPGPRRITKSVHHCIVNRDTGAAFVLCGNEVTIGSGIRGIDIRLTSSGVQRKHAVLALYQNGWAIEKVGKGEILLNDQPVTAPTRLFNGDVIAIADERLYYEVRTKNV